mgnify:CR=1 FL=1
MKKNKLLCDIYKQDSEMIRSIDGAMLIFEPSTLITIKELRNFLADHKALFQTKRVRIQHRLTN